MQKEKDIIVIGDVHGSASWKQIVDRYPGCMFVFLGDYCDPYHPLSDEQVLENFRQIIKFKREHYDEVILLLGNHDVHYYRMNSPLGSRFSLNLMMEIEELLLDNIDCFQCAFSCDNMLFTHAGVSLPWFEELFHGNVNEDIAEQLIARSDDDSLLCCGTLRGGTHAHGGIFWADKEELHCMPPHMIQIVGHTRVPEITYRKEGDSVVYFCDCLWQEKYLLIEHRDGKRDFYQQTLEGDKELLGE